MIFAFGRFASPVGELTMVASEIGLAALVWENDAPSRVRLGRVKEAPCHALLLETAAQLRPYFSGRLIRFDLPGPRCSAYPLARRAATVK
jgi:methylated-DNA-[protein]-cysteine S-methyltransferase